MFFGGLMNFARRLEMLVKHWTTMGRGAGTASVRLGAAGIALDMMTLARLNGVKAFHNGEDMARALTRFVYGLGSFLDQVNALRSLVRAEPCAEELISMVDLRKIGEELIQEKVVARYFLEPIVSVTQETGFEGLLTHFSLEVTRLTSLTEVLRAEVRRPGLDITGLTIRFEQLNTAWNTVFMLFHASKTILIRLQTNHEGVAQLLPEEHHRRATAA
jgi:hypothetical protein